MRLGCGPAAPETRGRYLIPLNGTFPERGLIRRSPDCQRCRRHGCCLERFEQPQIARLRTRQAPPSAVDWPRRTERRPRSALPLRRVLPEASFLIRQGAPKATFITVRSRLGWIGERIKSIASRSVCMVLRLALVRSWFIRGTSDW